MTREPPQNETSSLLPRETSNDDEHDHYDDDDDVTIKKTSVEELSTKKLVYAMMFPWFGSFLAAIGNFCNRSSKHSRALLIILRRHYNDIHHVSYYIELILRPHSDSLARFSIPYSVRSSHASLRQTH